MKYNLDEIFNSLKQKYWWILCVLCIPAGYYNVINAESLNEMYKMMFQNSAAIPPNMQTGIGVFLLMLLCNILIEGYLINYIKNYSEDIYYEEKEPNFVRYLITGLKFIPFCISVCIISILLGILPGFLAGLLGGFAKAVPALGIVLLILLILLFPIIILIGGGYGGCAYLLFAKTNKITSAFRLPTIFKMMFGNIMPIIKAILWIIFLFIPLVVIQISLYIIAAAIPIIALPVWIAITYCFYMFISNISAQLLRHISQNMGEELH